MKRLVCGIFFFASLCSCTSKADKAAAAATGFLTRLFNMDYAGAAAFCTDDIAAMLCDTVAAGDYPGETLRAKMAEASKKTGFTIVSSEVDEKTGAVVIGYEIRPGGAVGGGSILRKMRLEEIEGDWKIVSLE